VLNLIFNPNGSYTLSEKGSLCPGMALAADWDWYENIAAQGDDQIFISAYLKKF